MALDKGVSGLLMMGDKDAARANAAKRVVHVEGGPTRERAAAGVSEPIAPVAVTPAPTPESVEAPVIPTEPAPEPVGEVPSSSELAATQPEVVEVTEDQTLRVNGRDVPVKELLGLD